MKTHPIGDTGMQLPGAPKDRAKTLLVDFDIDTLHTNMADTLGVDPEDLGIVRYDINDEVNHLTLEEWQSNLTKAKVWPSPEYAEMVEAGIPFPAVLALKNIRDALPTKAVVPSPEGISEMAAIFAEAKEMEQNLHEAWGPLLDHLSGSTPTFYRIANHWLHALTTLDDGLGEDFFSISEHHLTGVTNEHTKSLIAEGLRESDLIFKEFRSTTERLKKVRDSYYGESFDRAGFRNMQAFFRSTDKLSGITDHSYSSVIAAESRSGKYLLRRISKIDISEFTEAADKDNRLGFYMTKVFKDLGKKPKTLAKDPQHTPSNKNDPEEATVSESDKKPRRPIRLNEDETKSLLNEVDTDELRDNPLYQSFAPLVEAGIARGAQIGNWVTQKERPALVKRNYDAIETLTSVMEIPPNLFGLGAPIANKNKNADDGLIENAYDGNQALGLAFGARGRSKAAAHFEPSLFIINLTRKKGAGSLAHEWMHALDYRLGSLLDKDSIKRQYHPTDVRRITASPRLEYFSEYMAMFWYLKTATMSGTTRDGEERLKEQVDYHIITGLKDGLTKETINAALPLMHGVSSVLREAYHKKPSHQMCIDRTLRSLSQNSFISYDNLKREGIASRHNKHLERYFGAEHDLDYSDRNTEYELLEDPSRDPLDSFYGLCNNLFIQNLSTKLGDKMVANLEQTLARDIRPEDKATIQYAIQQAETIRNINNVIEHAALWRLTNACLPPVPEDMNENSNRLDERHWRAALVEAIKDLPSDLLAFIKRSTYTAEQAGGSLKQIIRNIAPTDMGKNAGLQTIDLHDMLDTKVVKEIVKTTSICQKHSAKHWSYYNNLLAFTAEPSPEAKREMSRVNHRIGQHLSIVHDTMTKNITPTLRNARGIFSESDIAKVKCRLSYDNQVECDAAIAELLKSSEPGELWDSFVDESGPAFFYRAESFTQNHRGNLLAMLATAHERSEWNDGTLESFARSLSDPARLSPLPAGVIALHRHHIERHKHHYKDSGIDVDSVTDIEKDIFATVILEMTQYGLARTLQSGYEVNPDNFTRPQPDSALWVYAVSSFRRAIQEGDFSGMRSFDILKSKNKLSSFRYFPESDDRREAISSIMPASTRHHVYSALEGHYLLDVSRTPFKRKVRLNEMMLGADRVEYQKAEISDVLTNFREANFSYASSTAKGAAKKELSAKNESRIDASMFYPEIVPSAIISDFVKDSAAFEGGSITETGRTSTKSRKYWSTTRELFARMGEKVVHEILERRETPNPFLVTVPTNKQQNNALRQVNVAQSTTGIRGNAYALTYPSSEELDAMVRTFTAEVTPNMEHALSTLYPDSTPHYEAYLKKQAQAVPPDERRDPRQEAHDSHLASTSSQPSHNTMDSAPYSDTPSQQGRSHEVEAIHADPTPGL